MRFYIDQILKDGFDTARWQASRLAADFRNPEATAFYDGLVNNAPHASTLVDVLPHQRVVYLAVPKAASSQIRNILSEIGGRRRNRFKPGRRSRFGNPPTIRDIGVSSFYRIAKDRQALRFSFVRNPYDRLVSAWASKFQNRPLVPGKRFTRGTPELDSYLVERDAIDGSLPAGADHTLSFADFVTYATAVADRPVDFHLMTQARLLDLPGLSMDFLGRTEAFSEGMAVLFDHVGAKAGMDRRASARANVSKRTGCADYFSPSLADRVYRAYEEDFDRFGYPRAVPD